MRQLRDESVPPEPPHGYGRCFGCAADLPAGVVIALCDFCRPEGPRLPPTASAPPFPLRVVIDSDAPIPAQVVADVVVLRRVVEDYGAIWHDDAQLSGATELGERIEELLERLERVGVAARVVPLS